MYNSIIKNKESIRFGRKLLIKGKLLLKYYVEKTLEALACFYRIVGKILVKIMYFLIHDLIDWNVYFNIYWIVATIDNAYIGDIIWLNWTNL